MADSIPISVIPDRDRSPMSVIGYDPVGAWEHTTDKAGELFDFCNPAGVQLP